MPDDARQLDTFYASLAQAAGADAVSRDEAARALFSQDIFETSGARVDCIVAPTSTEALARVVAIAHEAGRPVAPRGGGMSYTSGYLVDDAEAVLVDTSRMDRILEINEADMYVTLEAGCTWASLYEALKAKGLRTPFWGPLSGLKSTIGGGLSQGNAFFGAGVWGTTAESLLSLTVVLADGAVLKTGSASTQGAKPFYRYYGPDLTGLFTGDCGALGFKAEATFRLMRAPKAEGYASFSFGARDDAAAAMAEMARDGVGTEVYGFDPVLMGVSMRRGNWSDDMKSLAGVVKGQKSVLAGVKEAAKIVAAGKDFAKDQGYTIHVSTEGRVQAAVDADLAAARKIAADHKGREIENSLPKVVRGTPFGPLNSMIGPEGQRWVPVHGLVAHSDAPGVWAAIQQLFDSYAAAFEKHDVITGYLTTTMSTNAFLIEPVFLWPEALYPLHEVSVDPAFLKRSRRHADNPEATALVTEVREKVARLFLNHGATHFQIGRTYLYKEGREPAAWRLLEAIKSAVDPHGRINKGSLGLG